MGDGVCCAAAGGCDGEWCDGDGGCCRCLGDEPDAASTAAPDANENVCGVVLGPTAAPVLTLCGEPLLPLAALRLASGWRRDGALFAGSRDAANADMYVAMGSSSVSLYVRRCAPGRTDAAAEVDAGRGATGSGALA